MIRLFILITCGALICTGSSAAPSPHASTATATATATISTPRWSTLADTVFEHLTAANGLPSSAATALAEDGEGFLWVGTQEGLARWDGYRFRIYQTDPQDANSLPDNFIQSLQLDRRGRLWIGTFSGGLALYDREHDRFIRVPVGPKGLSHARVNAIVDDGGDGLWIGTQGGLDHFFPSTGAVIHFRHDAKNTSGLPGPRVHSVLLDRNGKLWIGTNKGLVVQDNKSGGFFAVPLPTAGDSIQAIYSLVQSRDGKIWIGTFKDGAYFVDPKEGIARPVLQSGAATEFNHVHISSIHEARPGEIWLGSNGLGILVIDTSTLQTRRLRHDPSVPTSHVSDSLWALFRDRSGLVWTASLGGISRTDPGQVAVKTLVSGIPRADTRPETIAEFKVISVSPMPDDSIWLGLGIKGVNIIDAATAHIAWLRPDPLRPDTALPLTPIQSFTPPLRGDVYIATESGVYRSDVVGSRVQRVTWPLRSPTQRTLRVLTDGNILWVGGNDGLWRVEPSVDPRQIRGARAPGTEVLDKELIVALVQSADSTLWIGTSSGSLYRYDPGSHTLSQMTPNPAENTALSGGAVFSILVDSRGWLWVGTSNNVVHVLTTPNAKGTARFQRISIKSVGPLLEDLQGKIWAGNNVIDPTTFAVRSLKRADGVEVQDYFFNSGAKTAHGELLFGGAGGLTVIRPDLYKEWDYRPPLVVTDLKIGGKAVPSSRLNGTPNAKAEPLAITPQANSIAVEFAALDYSAPERNRYAYRLDGYDKDWIDTDPSRRLAAYTNLSPGDYRLRMRGSNRNGVWTGQELVLPIHVLPAWHQTWWIRVIEMLVAVAAIYALVQGRTRYLRQRQRDLESQVDQRTSELQESRTELLDKNAALAYLNQQQEIQKNELTAHKDELLDKNDELARLNQLQETQQSELTRFLAVASHDLRQPMHALNLYLGALSNYDMAESARPVLGNVRQCAEIMDSMFLALLDLSRLDADVVEPLIKAFPISKLLSSIEVEFTPSAQAKGLQLRIAPCSLWIQSDIALVAQIISNLVANAVRYTESGTILVGCKRRGNLLRLAVYDTGIGISPDQQKSVFDEFCQLGNVGRDRTKGLGLGLAIVRRLARLLAAPITLVSSMGKGSMFAVDLPIIEAPQLQQNQSQQDSTDIESTSMQDQLTGKLIVVIDDEASILDAMRVLLEQWGCFVMTAESGEAAIAKLSASARAPDALICDFQLRLNKTGLDVIDLLQDEFNCDIPAMIITGTITPQRIQEMALTGIPVLHKPVSADTLHKVLQRLVGRR